MLVLEVVSHHATPLGQAARRELDDNGETGTVVLRIGRDELANDWILAVPTVSRRQAVLRCCFGLWLLERTGGTPMAINDPAQALPLGVLTRLRDGDRLLIGDLEIQLSHVAGVATTPHPRNAGAADTASDSDHRLTSAPDPAADDTAVQPVVDLVEVEPEPESAALADPEVPDLIAYVARLARRDAVPAAASPEPALAPLWRAAGLDPALASEPHDIVALGQTLRLLVAGLHESLAARTDVRRGYRVPLTRAAAQGNNPLKFADDGDDALAAFFVRRDAAFLGLPAAVAEAFRELRDHQLALVKGEQAAFTALLGRFDPQRLERQLVPADESGLFRKTSGSKVWTAYRAHYAQLREDEDRTFRNYFAEPYARAYERELARLRGQDPGDDPC